ncbi:HBL/NHE enterotoxin family protein [Bacillus pseudomycoides]|uniref:non-hemolytic enterotoxin subunit C n=1 Tax=Bacillus pseudomycoides TaxID=64104 RepID=UPI001FB400E7|nr:HBL/NHE enterotoxin family protein [Bacillus pseudomycoides]
MNKRFYKKIMLSMMVLGVTTSNVIPHHTFAAEQTVQENNKQYSLGPEGFQDVMAQSLSSVLVMDSYAKTLRNQLETDLSSISSLNSGLRENMIKHQKDAQANAAYWLNTIKPKIMKTNQNVVNYNDAFQTQYSILLAAIDQRDTGKLKAGLEKLYQSILINKSEVDELLNQLKTFRSKMEDDTKSFKEDSNELTNALASTSVGIPYLQQQINNYNESIKKSNDMFIAGGVLVIFTLGASVAMIATAKSNIASAEREIANLKARISGAQAEVAILTDAKNKTTNMTETIDTAINSLQNISNNWHAVAAKYDNLLKNITFITPEEFSFLKEDLKTAKDSWQDLKNYADKLLEEVKIAEKKEQDLMNQLRPSNVFYYYKQIHNAYTFEMKTGTNAPNASYKVVNLTKNSVHNMWSGGPNTSMWADWLSFNPKDEFAVVAVIAGQEYVVYKDKVENIMSTAINK